MRGDEAVEALRSGDIEALGAATLDADVPAAIEAALPVLGKRARLVATSVLRSAGGAAAGRTLLAMSGDADPQVAGSATMGLLDVAPRDLPDAAFLTYSIAVRRSPLVRAILYGLVARTGDRSALPRLRALYDQERDARALASAHRAAIRLGAIEERRAFVARVEGAKPREVRAIEDELVEIGDPRMMRAAASWFDDERFVVSAGIHGGEIPIRVCDLAARAAARLGVGADADASLRRRSPAEVAAAKAAVLELPPLVDVPTRLGGAPALAAPPLVPALPPLPRQVSRIERPPTPVDMPLPTAEVKLPTLTPATPFVTAATPPTPREAAPTARPARPRPRFDTGTQDVEKAKAEVMAGVASTPFRAPSPTRPPPEKAQVSIGFEQFTWIRALEIVNRAAAEQARAAASVDEGSWPAVNAAWQAWLQADAERWQRFQSLLAEYQRRVRQGC